MLPFRTPFMALAVLGLALAPWPARAQWRTDGVPICTAASNQFTPLGIPDGSGGAILAWFDYRGGAADIYAQHVLASGTLDPAWPASGRAVCTAAGGQYSPVVIPDGQGGAIVVWHDDRTSDTDVYAHHLLSSGALDPAWPANGRALCAASADQVYPAAAPDGAGGVLATWRDYRGGPDTDVYAGHVTALGAADPLWPANGVALCTASGNQSVPAIAVDGAGGAFVTWSDLRNGVHSDIYVHHVLASGAADPAWPPDGLAICTASGNQSEPDILEDGAGGVIVAWFDYRNGIDSDVYAQHVLASGAADPAWPAGGRALCAAPGEQYSPVLAPDGAGGAIATWYDYRGGEEGDIYAQRVLASGAVDPAWQMDGRVLCTASGDQTVPSVAEDGAGGVHAAWFDYRGASCDVYAQHAPVTGAPDPSWPADGAGVCGAPGEQYSPAPIMDGAGGAIVAWTDFRGGNYSDIYAAKIRADGSVVAVGWDRGPAPGLGPVVPNPARGRATTRLELPAPARVTVEVLDSAGRMVRTLVAGAALPAGPHTLTWDGADDTGRSRPSGVYWVRVRGPLPSQARRLVLLR